jgi:anti-anti-sigma regulatory factor
MKTPAAKLMVLAGQQFACVKVAGRANFVTSVDFKNVLTGLTDKGYAYLVVELSECPLMDSTFLGVLAEFGVKMNPESGDCAEQAIELRNPNPRVVELLENLGVLHLFKTCQAEMPVGEIVESTPCKASREALTKASLEAHQTLMDLNPENVSRFKEVTRFLAEDLARQGGKVGDEKSI